jgi:hypothetical protein
MPVPACAEYSVVALGAIAAAGSEYGYVTAAAALAGAQVEPVSQIAVAGAATIVVAVVGSVCLPDLKVVEVAVTYQPAVDPVEAPTSIASAAVTVWFTPLRAVDANVTFAGVPAKPSEPAVSLTDDVVVAEADATATRAASVATVATAPATRLLSWDVLIILVVWSGAVVCGTSM